MVSEPAVLTLFRRLRYLGSLAHARNGSKPARYSLIGWSSDGRAESRPHRYAKRCGRGPRPTGLGPIGLKAPRFFGPAVFHLTIFFPHFQHRSRSNGNKGGVGYLLVLDLRYLPSKNPFFVSLVLFCEFSFLFARPFFTCLN